MENKLYSVHESSYIDGEVSIGPDTRIWYFCHIIGPCEIGAGCNIGQNVFIGVDVKLGNRVKIQNNVSVYSGVVCEDDVFLGPSMVFTNVINPRSFIERKNEFRTTLVKKGASIGANATIVCGVTIGSYSFIGAGAVVSRNVPDYALVYGNPARHQGWICKCGGKLDFKDKMGECRVCGLKYEQVSKREIRVK